MGSCAHMLRMLAIVTIAPAFACETQEPLVSPEARAWIDAAKAANDRADRALESGDREEARAVLDAVLDSTAPRSISADDRRVVVQDVHYRLATIELDDGHPDRALAHAEAGLAEGRAGDVFTANLEVTRGRALEALDREVEAADAYFEALEINDALLRQMLDRSDEAEEP
jgi:predicted negative regulator of RcsB-dependent stress response